MSRKARKGYYVSGEFVTAGGIAEQPTRDGQESAQTPSRTQRKHASEELQQIGEQLVSLRAERFAGLPLPEKLREAVLGAKRITRFGAKRRQMQLIGKLMRQLEPEALEAVRAALRIEHGQSAKEAQTLHRAEDWRDALIANDEQLEKWIAQFPGTNVRQLRALIREARKDAREAGPEAERHGRAYREIFKLVRLQLAAAAEPPQAGSSLS
jgi:ribosome-associated protein